MADTEGIDDAALRNPGQGDSTPMPPGLPYIVVNEAAERYSFYGMRSILTVFMTTYLVDRSGVADPMTDTTARVWYHTFVMAVYFMPLLGALLADLVWGKYRTIIYLSLVYCAGHLVLALDTTRLGLMLGLGLIAAGAGGIKPTVSAHLGDQFGPRTKHLVSKAYAHFYFAINVGAVLSMVAGEWLLHRFGAHVAFGIPGALMLLATAVFWFGRHEYRSIPPSPWREWRASVLKGPGGKAVVRLVPLFALVAVFWSLYDQTGSSWVQQAQSGLMDRTFHIGSWSLSILPSQVQAVNAVLILLFVPLFTAVLFPWLRRKGWEPKPLRLIGVGLFLTTASFAVMSVLAERMYAGEEVHISGQLLAYVLLTAAEVLVSMTCLEFAYTQAPNAAKSLVMGLYFLSFALGNFMAVEVNHFMAQPVQVHVTEEGFLQLPGEHTLHNERQVAFGRGTSRHALTASGDTIVLQGSFLMRDTDLKKRQFALREPRTREALVVLPKSGSEPGPESVPEPWSEPGLKTRPRTESESRPENRPEFGPEPRPESGPELKPQTGSEPRPDSGPELKPQTGPEPGPDKPVMASLNRLAGPWYFLFFTGLMLVAALAFIPLAMAFKPRTFLQTMPGAGMSPL